MSDLGLDSSLHFVYNKGMQITEDDHRSASDHADLGWCACLLEVRGSISAYAKTADGHVTIQIPVDRNEHLVRFVETITDVSEADYIIGSTNGPYAKGYSWRFHAGYQDSELILNLLWPYMTEVGHAKAAKVGFKDPTPDPMDTLRRDLTI